jgi:hypothetical protein
VASTLKEMAFNLSKVWEVVFHEELSYHGDDKAIRDLAANLRELVSGWSWLFAGGSCVPKLCGGRPG